MINAQLGLRAKRQGVWELFLAIEIEDGSQFIRSVPDDRLYMIQGSTGQIIPLPRSGRGGDAFFAYLHMMYGLPEREDWARFLYDSIRPFAFTQGTRVELRRFAAYDRTSQTAYLSAYNGRMWKIEGSTQITDHMIGEDGVFFVDDDPGTHATPDIGAHGVLIDTLTNINFAPSGLSGIAPETQRRAMIIWLFALAFPDLLPTKPMLILEGTQGSGKSASLQLIQHALMGVSKPLIISRNKEDDFGVVLLRSPLAIFDNLDSYVDWLPDAVCAYTTSGSWTKRRLFSDDEEIVLKPHAFIAVASKNPASFRREDVADRCIICRLERRSKFTRFEALVSHIQENRPRLLGEYLWYVGRIVDELRMQADDAAPETFRMADFAALGRIVGKVFEWPDDAVPEIMEALQSERDAFINEEDPLVDLLRRWVSYRLRDGRSNVGRTVTGIELNSELKSFAEAAQIQWKHTPRTLAQKLRSPHIDREFFIEHGILNNNKTYRIYRQTDPRLAIVDENE